MIQLTTNVSEPLLELLERGDLPIDGVEVGPWFSLQEIRMYRRMLPSLSFTFHGADLIERVGVIPGAMDKVRAYARCTDTPWISMHLSVWLPGMRWLMHRYGWRIPAVDPQRVTRWLARRIGKLVDSMSIPVMLENPDPVPLEGYDPSVEPQWIGEVLEGAGCDLLLDTGHARVSASALGMDVAVYLGQLPLDRVRQVHVSGPRLRDGRLVDAHEPLQEVDYELLHLVLSLTELDMVTLEYTRRRHELGEQLVRLRRIVDAHSRSGWGARRPTQERRSLT